ncbi:hypothetical protein II582_02980, partial [bacterium]|nr:hypothetical protein [bacterium]
ITGYYPLLPEKCSIVEYEGEAWLKYAFSRGQVAAVAFLYSGKSFLKPDLIHIFTISKIW